MKLRGGGCFSPNLQGLWGLFSCRLGFISLERTEGTMAVELSSLRGKFSLSEEESVDVEVQGGCFGRDFSKKGNHAWLGSC